MAKVKLVVNVGTVVPGRFGSTGEKAHLAELVDALDLGSSGFGRGGSSPPVGISQRSTAVDPAIHWFAQS